MRESICGDVRSSELGFGCGSVLGRVGRRASLRGMAAAWDAGITLFDTARSYGFGDAEGVLGEFLQGKREQAVIATKYGIRPQRPSAVKRAALPVVRAGMRVPGVRGMLRGGGSHAKEVGEFSVEGLRASVEESLRQLRTDRVELLFLHEATVEVMRDQELMAELQRLVQAGKALRVGLYADAGVVAEAVADGPAVLSAMQFGADPFDPVVARLEKENARGTLMLGNHPFGGEKRLARMRAVLAGMAEDEDAPQELREKLRGGEWEMVLEAVFGMALDGVHALVLSMMREEHVRANVRAVERNRFTAEELGLMRARMLGAASIL